MSAPMSTNIRRAGLLDEYSGGMVRALLIGDSISVPAVETMFEAWIRHCPLAFAGAAMDGQGQTQSPRTLGIQLIRDADDTFVDYTSRNLKGPYNAGSTLDGSTPGCGAPWREAAFSGDAPNNTDFVRMILDGSEWPATSTNPLAVQRTWNGHMLWSQTPEGNSDGESMNARLYIDGSLHGSADDEIREASHVASGVTTTSASIGGTPSQPTADTGTVDLRWRNRNTVTEANGEIFNLHLLMIDTQDITRGYKICSLASSGLRSDHWANTVAGENLYSTANLATLLTFFDPNWVFVQLGANNGSRSKANYKTDLETLITNMRAAEASATLTDTIKYALVSQYFTTNHATIDFEGYSEANHEISLDDPFNVCAINLYERIARDYTYAAWNTAALSDGTHLDADGVDLIGPMLFDLIEGAPADGGRGSRSRLTRIR